MLPEKVAVLMASSVICVLISCDVLDTMHGLNPTNLDEFACFRDRSRDLVHENNGSAELKAMARNIGRSILTRS